MKLLGLIGGMSWENTIEYYRVLNEMVKNTFKKRRNPSAVVSIWRTQNPECRGALSCQ